ncbi:MAG: glycosyltransferase family 2 protein [Saprospiraceae bacterium]
MDITIVVPLYNEEESLPELLSWIERVVLVNHFTYEVIMVDDGSNDSSWEIIQQLSAQNPNVHGIKFRRNYGKSAALHIGFQAALGDVVITMDADLQDSPDEIPELYRMIKEDDFHLVSGWKQKRYDPLSKTIPTKLYNWATRALHDVHLHDINCGLKAYKNEVVKNIEVYGEMHRYIPIIAKWAGFTRIGEKVVQHQARKYGVTKFGLERFMFGLLDLLSITVVARFGKRPMHFFGTFGVIMFMIGLMAVTFLGIDKMVSLYVGEKAPLVTTRPWFYIALTTMILGTQLFLAGFLAELIARQNPDKNNYEIEKKI